MCLDICFEKYPEMTNCHIFIDVNNVIRNRFRKEKKPVLQDLIILINYLVEIGFKKENIHSICDPGLNYYIDNPIEFEALIKEGIVIEAPKVADEFILSFAKRYDFCFIISNDKFREYYSQLPDSKWLEDRRVSFMFIDQEVCLSPNIDYNRIELFSNEKEGCPDIDLEDINREASTLDVLNYIENIDGEFDLF